MSVYCWTLNKLYLFFLEWDQKKNTNVLSDAYWSPQLSSSSTPLKFRAEFNKYMLHIHFPQLAITNRCNQQVFPNIFTNLTALLRNLKEEKYVCFPVCFWHLAPPSPNKLMNREIEVCLQVGFIYKGNNSE